jgi:putative hemolysin
VWTIELAVMLAMIAINSIFAAYEIALASIGIARLDTLAREHRRGATAALRMKNNMEASLAVVQLGITLVGAIAAATGGAGAEESIEPHLLRWGVPAGVAELLGIAIIVIPLTTLTIIFGELVPKVFALRNKEWVCLRLSPEMEWFAWSVWPAVWLFETSVTVIMSWSERRWRPAGHEGPRAEEAALQELRALAAIARTSRLIGSREEGIIVNAARLANLRVRQIMLPADAISMLDVNDDLTNALIAAHEDMHTRFPVTERPGDPQSIIGYVNFKDIVACMRIAPREPSLRSILRPLSRLLADDTVAAALEKLIREHNHIALVRDDAGDVVGMVTLEDVIEELVGEIHDEFDRLPTHITAAGPNWIVGGGAQLAQLERITGLQFPTADMLPPPHVLNDWLVRRLGRPVERGEEIKLDGMRILVRKERRKNVQEAQVSRVAETTATREATSGAI